MLVYHEVSPDAVESVLQNGLKRTSRGEKGDDTSIIATDRFLDLCCPKKLREAEISRDNNIYAYVESDGAIIDITSGESIPIEAFIANSKQKVLELTVDPTKCYVSDLDTFDALKEALQTREPPDVLDTLAKSYWNKVIMLSEFNIDMIRRPEVLITYDVPANFIVRRK